MGEKLTKAAQDLLEHIRSQEIQTGYKLSLDDRFMTKPQLLKKNILKALQELMEAGHIYYTISQERCWTSTRSGH